MPTQINIYIPVNIQIFNDQTDLAISEEAVQLIAKSVLFEENITCDELSITFISNDEMCTLHEEFFNDPTPTDCISFPMDDPEEETHYCVLGEIFVCPFTAIKYAKEHHLDPYTETTLYIVHGLLHLFGYDDIEDADRIEMKAAEARHIKILQKKGLLLTISS